MKTFIVHITIHPSQNVLMGDDYVLQIFCCTCYLYSTGEVIHNVANQEFNHQQGAITRSNHTTSLFTEVDNKVDDKIADEDNKTITDNNKTTTDTDSSTSINNTLVAEDNTEIVHAQPVELLMVSTQPQPTVPSSKENVQDDIIRSVSDQSTLSQSSEQISETITHTISQPKIVGMFL